MVSETAAAAAAQYLYLFKSVVLPFEVQELIIFCVAHSQEAFVINRIEMHTICLVGYFTFKISLNSPPSNLYTNVLLVWCLCAGKGKKKLSPNKGMIRPPGSFCNKRIDLCEQNRSRGEKQKNFARK